MVLPFRSAQLFYPLTYHTSRFIYPFSRLETPPRLHHSTARYDRDTAALLSGDFVCVSLLILSALVKTTIFQFLLFAGCVWYIHLCVEFAFSSFALFFSISPVNRWFQISGLRMRIFAWNRVPIKLWLVWLRHLWLIHHMMNIRKIFCNNPDSKFVCVSEQLNLAQQL